jgi:peptidoglycan/xylan/chitin deacetylase (PgdA/CDA1 family)
VHTWSHPSLTTLTNEEIIAELGWSKKIISDVLGVTPNMMRYYVKLLRLPIVANLPCTSQAALR